ncbi:MAG TPA: YihY/virulence factor BrkB family protein [Steroidobacteraceae bacterium]|nr:YihY/virulence factor BrkB family protein [Steroidobacteraceae bacterium]
MDKPRGRSRMRGGRTGAAGGSEHPGEGARRAAGGNGAGAPRGSRLEREQQGNGRQPASRLAPPREPGPGGAEQRHRHSALGRAPRRAGLRPWHDVHELWLLVRDAGIAWAEDRAPRKGAALAYYTAFSLAPILIIAIAIAGTAFGEQAARGQIYAQMKALLGPVGAQTVQAMIASAARPGRGTLPTVIGIITLAIGATSALAELKDGLDQIWDAPRAPSSGFLRYLWDFLRTRLLSIGLILALGFLLLISLVLSAVLAAFANLWDGSGTSLLLQSLNFLVSFALVTALFATIYKMLPSVPIAWRDVITGAAVTALLFDIGKHLIGVYLGNSAATSMYGAAGSLLVVLIWVYYSAQIFLYGAEFTKIYAYRFGSLRPRSSAALH